MPGCSRLGWRHGLIDEVYKARDVGVNSVVLFPKVPDALKSPTGDEAFNPDGIVPRSIRLLKDRFPDLMIYTDVALDPYNSDGHDGIVREDGVIMNDETVHQLCKQAVCQAKAGADCVAPSDMMDGRVGAIREALDMEGFTEVSIMAYTAKFASALYGPFREALDSNPKSGDKKTYTLVTLPTVHDKSALNMGNSGLSSGLARHTLLSTCSYQMDPKRFTEALTELECDEAEGADIVMVKPAGHYHHVIRLLRDNTSLPVAAYQVSGEYAKIKFGAMHGAINEEADMMESLVCIKSAGANIILTYFAIDAARVLAGERF
eukprot:SM000443S16315  [mRNA]  locus=s443:20343:23386:- [translate_table: standard]